LVDFESIQATASSIVPGGTQVQNVRAICRHSSNKISVLEPKNVCLNQTHAKRFRF